VTKKQTKAKSTSRAVGAPAQEAPRLRPSLQWFAGVVEGRLAANDYKGNWDDLSLELLLARLVEEAGELALEIGRDARTRDAIIHEAADVAAYALMLADRAHTCRHLGAGVGQPAGGANAPATGARGGGTLGVLDGKPSKHVKKPAWPGVAA
jgi:hypothetical protein